MRRQQNTVIVIFNTIRLNFCKLCFLDVCVSKYWRFIHQFIKKMFLPLCPTFDSLSFYPCQSAPVPPSPPTKPLLFFVSDSQGWGHAALQLHSSEPGWHHHIAALSLAVPIHHPDHHRQHQQHHLRKHTCKHIHLDCEKIKETRAPHHRPSYGSFAGLLAYRKEKRRDDPAWVGKKPLTCTLPTIYLNKPQNRQIWWVRLQASQGKQQHNKQEKRKEPPLHMHTHPPPHHSFPRGELHFLSVSHQLI